ncbi:hypothetical protein BDN67DRAFT_973393, partial [Paxillus ammoniavirescens]
TRSFRTLIFAWDTRPLPHEIERGPYFHCWSYICFSQGHPNINPGENVAQPTAQLSPVRCTNTLAFPRTAGSTVSVG